MIAVWAQSARGPSTTEAIIFAAVSDLGSTEANAGARRLPKDRPGYRPDIDGLRAVAVVLVIAFHAGVVTFGGGFIGVDVFFVLTGFLITGLLVDEYRRTGQISLTAFYARRIRRLLPLAALVIMVTAAAGLVLLPPLSGPDLLADARASLLYFVNWRFAVQATSYADVAVTDSLLLHFWSLSVEEQFYIVWPIVAVLVAWFAVRGRRAFVPSLGIAVGLMSLASVVASIMLTDRLGPEAYYVTYTRIWEIGLGAGLALLLPSLVRPPRFVLECTAVVGLIAIVAAAVIYTGETTFPGSAALIPTLGTALVIASGTLGATVIKRMLSLRPLPYLGRISYALYLWHWPLIGLALLANEKLMNPRPESTIIALAVLLTFVLSAASHKWIENPLRYSRWIRAEGRRTYAMGATAIAVPLAFIVLYLGTGDFGASVNEMRVSADGNRSIALSMSPDEAGRDVVSVGPNGCHAPPEEDRPDLDCFVGDQDATTVVALFGDSHARHWLPAMEVAATERDWLVFTFTKSGCVPLDLRMRTSVFSREYYECESWRDAVVDYLDERGDVDAIVVSKSSRGYSSVIDSDGESKSVSDSPELWSEGAARTFNALTAFAGSVIVLRDTPAAENGVPTCLSDAEYLSDCNLDLTVDGGLDAEHHRLEKAVAVPGVHFVDPSPLVCPRTICSPVTEGGVIKYSDSHHLSQTFSRELGGALGELIAPYVVNSNHRD